MNNVTTSTQAAKGLGFYTRTRRRARRSRTAAPNRTWRELRRRRLGRGAAADFPRHRGVAARPLALVGPRALPARRADAAAARGRRARRRAPAAEGYARGRRPSLTSAAATSRLTGFARRTSPDGAFADALLRAYALLLHDLDLLNGESHNLLVGRGWLLVVARRAREANGVDVNALGFAGCLLARDAATFESLLAPGACGEVWGVAVAASGHSA